MTVSDNTIQAKGLGNFFKNLERFSAKAGKKFATKVLKKPGRALENTSNIAAAFATKSPKAALSSLPEVINFYHMGKSLYLPRLIYIMLNKWTKKQIHYTHQQHLKIKMIV